MNESSVFGIICDETMDISRIEKFSVCVRYVTTDLRVRERFLGFWKAKKTDGESLLELLSILTYFELNVANIRAQCQPLGTQSMYNTIIEDPGRPYVATFQCIIYFDPVYIPCFLQALSMVHFISTIPNKVQQEEQLFCFPVVFDL